MRKIVIPSAKQVVAVNKYVCQQGGNTHYCYGIGRVESAI
mgnify:FL=1